MNEQSSESFAGRPHDKETGNRPTEATVPGDEDSEPMLSVPLLDTASEMIGVSGFGRTRHLIITVAELRGAIDIDALRMAFEPLGEKEDILPSS